MNNTEDNALNLFIKVISVILTSVIVIPIFGAMLYTKVFSFKILIFLIMFIIVTCIIFKLKKHTCPADTFNLYNMRCNLFRTQ